MKHASLNTIQLPIREFAKKNICDGHLYLVTKESRRFYLMKPGLLIDPSFIKKHAPHNTVFEFSPVVNEEVKQHFNKLFKELLYLKFERDLRIKTSEIVSYFQKVYSGEEHLLSFASSCYENLNRMPEEILLKMHETDMHLFRKSLYSAAFAVIIAMSNDYYHPLMLRDFFNVTFSQDMGLCENEYSYFVAQACNIENRHPGSGRDWMIKEGATASEINVFLQHPRKTYEFLKQTPDLLAFNELAEIALYQHELADGTGFPRGIHKGLISSWESIVILADSLVEIEDQHHFENVVISYILNFQNEKLKDLPVGKIYKKLCLNLQYFVNAKESGA